MAEDEIEKNEDETEEDVSDGEDAEESGGFSLKKIIIFLVLPLLILGGGIGAAYFMGYLDSILGIEKECEEITDPEDPRFEECRAELAAAGKEGAAPGFYYDIPDIRVNLNTSGRNQQFLFLVVKLEVPDQETLDQIEQYAPRITDHFQTYLRELRLEDLQGSAGIYRLRLELLERVNAAAPEIEVRDVLFQEMLVQ